MYGKYSRVGYDGTRTVYKKLQKVATFQKRLWIKGQCAARYPSCQF